LKEFEVQKAEAEAKKAALDAEKARIEAAKSLATAKASDPTADATKDAEAQKKLVDAQTALLAAQQQAWITKFIGGEVKAGPYSGNVEMGDGAGKVEAALLAAKALEEGAAKIVEAVRPHPATNSRVYVFDASKPPSFDRLMNFNFRFGLIEQAFAAAGVSAAPPATKAMAAAAVTAATVAAGLGAVANILGFFKTDTKVGGIESKLDEMLAVKVVAGALAKNVTNREVHAPSLFKPKATADAVQALVDKLTGLLELRMTAAANAKQAGIAADEAARLQAAIDLYDAFVSQLTTTDASGTAPLVAVADEHALWEGMTGGIVLLLRLETSGGSYLVKKHMLAGLFRAPLFYSGGAAVSYVLFDGLSGKVLAGGVVPVQGKYVRVSALRGALGG
jgi:hypothetical protein